MTFLFSTRRLQQQNKTTKTESSNHAPEPQPTKALLPSKDDERVQQLGIEFPSTTVEERQRFLRGRTIERAQQKLKIYVEWRTVNKMDELQPPPSVRANDGLLWDFAASTAAKSFADIHLPSSGLPRIVRFGGKVDKDDGGNQGDNDTDMRAKSGKRIVQVLPGLISKKIAPMPLYVLCTAIYLDLKLDRSSLEEIRIVVDVRAGKGWANPSPMSLKPFAKSICQVTADIFPERLSKCAIYPVSGSTNYVYKSFLKSLNEKHANNIKVISGSASEKSQPPLKVLRSFLDDHTIDMLEENRVSSFID